MKLDFTNERVLAVVAHPDDAELLCAGTLARAKADGAAVAVCVLCSGDKGQSLTPVKNLSAVRKAETRASAKLLGAEAFFVGIKDGELTDTRAHCLKLVEVFRRFCPTLVLAHAVEDYHSDHRAASVLTEMATWFCAARAHRTQSPAMPASPALWWMDTLQMHQFTPGFYIDVSAYITLKEQMLACHRSQLARGKDGDFSPLQELLSVQSRARGMQAGVRAAEAFRLHPAFKRARAW